jgi:hypothetical protein
MAKRVFFSFHYDDVIAFRANVVRKHDVTKDTGTAGFFDASIWGNHHQRGERWRPRAREPHLQSGS